MRSCVHTKVAHARGWTTCAVQRLLRMRRRQCGVWRARCRAREPCGSVPAIGVVVRCPKRAGRGDPARAFPEATGARRICCLPVRLAVCRISDAAWHAAWVHTPVRPVAPDRLRPSKRLRAVQKLIAGCVRATRFVALPQTGGGTNLEKAVPIVSSGLVAGLAACWCKW